MLLSSQTYDSKEVFQPKLYTFSLYSIQKQCVSYLQLHYKNSNIESALVVNSLLKIF